MKVNCQFVKRCMMTSSNGNIFRGTGHLCGEFTGPGEFPTQRPVTRSFDVFFDVRLNKRLSKQPWGWWFETPSWSLWRHCNEALPSQSLHCITRVAGSMMSQFICKQSDGCNCHTMLCASLRSSAIVAWVAFGVVTESFCLWSFLSKTLVYKRSSSVGLICRSRAPVEVPLRSLWHSIFVLKSVQQHHSDVIWELWRWLKLPAILQFIQQLIQASNKKDTKALHQCYPIYSPHKRPLSRKPFHMMTSLCSIASNLCTGIADSSSSVQFCSNRVRFANWSSREIYFAITESIILTRFIPVTFFDNQTIFRRNFWRTGGKTHTLLHKHT